MKTLNSSFIRCILTPLVSTSLIIFLTAGSCDSTDNRPSIQTTFTQKWDIPLDPVFLRYDLNKFVNDCQRYGNTYPAADIQDLSTYSNLCVASSWLTFFSLFSNSDNYPGVGPEVKFIFTQPDCSGSFTLSYNKFDADLCERNIIKNAPKINKPHTVDFSAHTIKSRQNNIFVKWHKEFLMTGQGSYLVIDQSGTVDYPSYMFTSSTKSGKEVAIRYNKDCSYEIVQNTVCCNIEEKEYNAVIKEEAISPVMEKDVIYCGEVKKSLKWNTPIIAELR